MIKVELLYKVSMLGSDWTMSSDEFEEFRKEVLNLPVARLEHLQREPIVVYKETEDNAEECPDYIEPPEFYGNDIIPEVKAQEEPKKEKILPDDPYQKYIDMILDGHQKTAVLRSMINDLDIAGTTAENYYYQKVKPRADAFKGLNKHETEKKKKIIADREFEKQKKDLLKNLETKTNTNGKIHIIPPHETGVPEPGKLFSKEFREMIQEKSKGSNFFKGGK